MPGVKFPVETTIVQTPDYVLVISPGPVDLIKSHIPLGKAILVVAPNALHYFHLESFLKSFPNAKLYGPDRLKPKVTSLEGILNPIEHLSKLEDLELFHVGGNSFLDETLIYIKPLKTLITTDLCFNMVEPMPLGRRFLLRLVGAHNKPAQSRLVKLSTNDRKAYHDSIDGLKNLDIQKVIVGHGKSIEGKAALNDFFRAIGLNHP
jgi:hypothetical protein